MYILFVLNKSDMQIHPSTKDDISNGQQWAIVQ